MKIILHHAGWIIIIWYITYIIISLIDRLFISDGSDESNKKSLDIGRAVAVLSVIIYLAIVLINL